MQIYFTPFFRLLAILNSLLLAISIFGLFYPESFIVDLFGNFLFQTILMSSTGSVLFFFRRDRTSSLVSFALLLIKGQTLMPFIHLGEQQQLEKNFTVMVSNVNGQNTHFDEVIEGVKSRNLQIVGFLEVNSEWDKHLKSLSSDFPFAESVIREDNFGLALYSKIPLLNVTSGSIRAGEPPVIKASIEKKGERINLFLVHTVPPRGSDAFDLRNKQLKELGKFVKEDEGESILLGDLNTTPWSVHFNNLLKEAGLVDPRRTFGILPSWTQDFFLFLIPIDHILTTKNLIVSSLELHKTKGSDHRALVADIVN